MSPTLRNGEQVLAYTPLRPVRFRRGSIVTLRQFNLWLDEHIRAHPNFAEWLEASKVNFSELFLKRVIGLPYDIIRIPKRQLATEYIDRKSIFDGMDYIWHIPAGHVFVRGDGVDSVDSISWGPIPISALRQIVLCRYPSLRRIR